ncbi:hypothetical protein PPERSA_11761 [Pseudocohnilembus persalinus]|uniref:Papain family cysteine protease n=1 Tax=Pseudocohnilembus persalinus TaxID=266149 RepID=A0A0V0QGG5_PSEPJ|nr:hypothetical protein PPERSA_11761 [Pseudocohnilembus persalinus]|eukprot:KRX01314.1 hypothetical protein PPERSA_11761 [Pseudocohnilembus persalinus]
MKIQIVLLSILAISSVFFVQKQNLTENQKEDYIIYQKYLEWKEGYKQEKQINNLRSSSDNYRFSIFKENYLFVEQYNQSQNDVVLEINQFADLSQQEFQSKFLNYLDQSENYELIDREELDILTSEYVEQDTENNTILLTQTADYPPIQVDWTQKGKVTKIKNQGNCGSCWAFATAGAYESAYAIQNGFLNNLSEQKILDCQLNYGCNGGFIEFGMRYSEQYGLGYESVYPYVSGQTGKSQQCTYPSDKIAFYGKQHYRIQPNSPAALQKYLIDRPLAITVDASSSLFQFYNSGIIASGCGVEKTHAVLLTGYSDDVSDGKNRYWKIKNSWGTSWGENGYVRILKSQYTGVGVCGVMREAWYATV